MWSKIGLASVTLAASMSVGCGQPAYTAKELGSSLLGDLVDNGVERNGLRANGLRANGLRANGLRANGVSMHVSNITDGAITTVSDDDAAVYFSPSQLGGTTVIASLEDGSAATYRIDSIDTTTRPGLTLYNLSYWDGAAWQLACGTDPSGYYAPIGQPIPAIALADTWNLVDGSNEADPSMFTFGCVNAAVGKCVIWGYQRWSDQQECQGGSCKSQDLSFFHEACTRLVRADYCGDGHAHTRNGTSIDVYDSLNIQQRTGVDGYTLEAEWRYDGAHCIDHTRWQKADPTMDTAYATDLDYVTAKCPSRLASNDASCSNQSTSHFYTQYGFSDSLASRSVLRDETTLHY